jgi:hypothetical protein
MLKEQAPYSYNEYILLQTSQAKLSPRKKALQ